MKITTRRWVRSLVIVLVLVAGSLHAFGQTTPANTKSPVKLPWLLVGGRIGLEYDFTSQSSFNARIQAIFPTTSKTVEYFPLYSHIGVSVTERIPIGDTGFRMTITELPLVSGFDQNYSLPSFTLLIGFETDFGLMVSAGPSIEPISKSGGLAPGLSLIYSAGYRLTLGSISIPMALLVDPLPPDRHVRLGLIAGVDYGFRPSIPKKSTPFNY